MMPKPLPPLSSEQIADGMRRVHERTDTDPETGCWIWLGYAQAGRKSNNPYAKFTLAGFPLMVHRFVCHTQNGPIPYGYEVDHTCNNTLCVNPEHLEAVTPAENLRRYLEHSGKAQHHQNCGTPAGYTRHKKAGDTRCEPCWQAHNEDTRRHKRLARANRKTLLAPALPPC